MRDQESFELLRVGNVVPQISILMPIRNCEKFVAQAIRSVLDQREVVAEIIISDDASTDQTYPIALQTIHNCCLVNRMPHTIVIRRGVTQLRRAHFQVLRDRASCEIAFEAHGDDIQHPYRSKAVLEVFSRPELDASVVYVDSNLIDGDGVFIEKKSASNDDVSILKIDTNSFLVEHISLIGAAMAWKMARLSVFCDVNELSAVGHDRIRGFRGALSGGCYFINSPLYDRRIHNANMHLSDFSEPIISDNIFGRNLIRLSFFKAMQKDLDDAYAINLIDKKRFDQLHLMIENNINISLQWLNKGFKMLTEGGYTLSWKKN